MTKSESYIIGIGVNSMITAGKRILAACLWLLPWSACAAVTNVTVLGTTATQAVLSYTAPDASACIIQVSENPSFVPLSLDVDPSIFPGQNSDQRPHEFAPGRARLFVVGRRTSALGADGAWYSRALQTNTVHYYQITCPSDGSIASGTFKTSNIPTGGTFNDGLPFSAAAPGRTALPTLGPVPGTAVIDPQTGVLIRRMTGYGEEISGHTGNYPFTDAVDTTGNWSTPSAALADDTNSATIAGHVTPLFLRAQDMNMGLHISYVQAIIKASVTGAATIPDDSTVQMCLTTDGFSCYSKIVSQLLTSTQTQYTIGDTTPGNMFWAANNGQVGIYDYDTRGGRVNTNGTAVTLVPNSGSVFNIRWKTGSTFNIAGTEYKISSVTNETALTLTTSAGNQTNAVYNGTNFGLLIWKKTASADTVALQYAVLFGSFGQISTFPNSGSTDMCTTQTFGDANGKQGYHCLVRASSGGTGHLYWVSPSDGETRFLGTPTTDFSGGPYGYDRTPCAQNSFTFDATNQNIHYCLNYDHSGRLLLMQGTYTGPNTAVTGQAPGASAPGLNYANLTPGPGPSLTDLFQAFDARYDPSKFNNPILLVGQQAGKLVINAFRAGQNTLGWNFIVDPGNGLPLGSGGTLRIVGAQNTWSSPNARWCTIHTTLSLRDSPQLNVQANTLSAGGQYYQGNTQPGLGPYRVTTATAVTSAFSACPANTVDPTVTGTTQCSSIVVSGEPQDPNYNVDGPYLQDAAAGDILVFYSSGLAWDYEPVRLLVKTDSTHWIIQRNWAPTPFHDPNFTHAASSYLYEWCQANLNAGEQPVGGTYWWDWGNDPHGTNVTGATVTPDFEGDNHPTYRNGVSIWEGGCGDGFDAMQIRVGTWPAFVNTPDVRCNHREPAFAGFTGGVNQNFSDSHSSYSQTTAPLNEQQWFTDARNITGSASAAARVSGLNQTYKIQMDQWDTTAVRRQGMFASCGYNLLEDVSAPASVKMLSDTAADNYELCIANQAGECLASSSAGDVYVNCPYVSSATPTCGSSNGDTNDVCVGFNGAYSHSIVQETIKTSLGGLGNRVITKGLARYRIGFYVPGGGAPGAYWNTRPLADGSWTLVDSPANNLNKEDILVVKLPPYPPADSIVRSTFVPITLSVAPPPGLQVDNAFVEFGYSDNGNPEDLYCTTRKEICVATSATVSDTAPFNFEKTETFTGMPCATGCVIQVPAITQRILYYRAKYRDSSNNVLSVSSINAVAVP